MLKQVILVRQDLKLPKGKLAVQVAHASLEAAQKVKSRMKAWKSNGAKKVVLKVEDQAQLEAFGDEASKAGLPVAEIYDAGKTVLEPGTMTCVGIGPAPEGEIDKITGMLKCL